MNASLTATRIIPDLPHAMTEKVALILKEKLRKNPNLAPRFVYRGCQVYSFGDAGTGYICLVKAGEILYFVRHQRVRYSGFPLGRQVLLWRTPDKLRHPEVVGFAQHVFFRVLLTKYPALIADTLQTAMGRDFWFYALQTALRSPTYHCYKLDRRGKVTLTPLLSEQDVEDNYKDLWGTTSAHELVFAVISTKPLALKSKD